MAVLSLPLSFNNSFWSQDYRRGLEVLFNKLEQGLVENSEIISLIRTRATAEAQVAASLTNAKVIGTTGYGFNGDDGASLLVAFRGLQAESAAQGQAHMTISKELDTLVADPFEQWAQGYAERISSCKTTVLDSWLKSYEQTHAEVAKLRQQYLAKNRRADEAEDDAKFAPVSPPSNAADSYTRSPRIRPAEGRAPPQRTASVSERIAARLKEIQSRSPLASLDGSPSHESGKERHTEKKIEEEKPLPVVDKGKRRAVDEPEAGVEGVTDSPPPMSPMSPLNLPRAQAALVEPPTPVVLSDVPFTPAALTQILIRAAAELRLRPVRFPLLGEYQDCFSGEEFAAWLCHNVTELERSLDRAEDAARDLTEREGLLRRVGEFGNQFEPVDDAWYQFRPKAFNLHGSNSSTETTNASAKNLQAGKLIGRTGNLVSLVSKAFNANGNEPAWIRARRDADEADKAYRVAVRSLDRRRLGLEERIEDTLKILQRWEGERLRAVKTVLLQYQGTLANLPRLLDASINERSSTLVTSFQPESDLNALIERYRTGPFRPDPQVYESAAHEEHDAVFGIDLRKWAEGGWYLLSIDEEEKDKEVIPPVLVALMGGLQEAYEKLPNDAELRKAWIYDVPLPAVHHLREELNAVPSDEEATTELVAKYDAPVIAATIKLWLLELNPPLVLYEGWDELRKLYPTVGAPATGDEKTQEERVQALCAVLLKLPKVHLYVLDEILKHLDKLIASTEVEESKEVYITKLALSIGRAIVRPKVETEMTIQDRHPSLFFVDLLTRYDDILPSTIERKKRESERKVPTRKRTVMVDMRLSRSRISVGADTQQLLAAQQLAQNPSLGKNMKSPELPSLPPPPLPPLPEDIILPPPPPAMSATPPPPPPGVPSFKEPPPEVEEHPTRPVFKEPPPESPSPPPDRPSFKEPLPEDYHSLPIPVATTIIPPTAQKHSNISSARTENPPPPVNEDQVLGTGRTSLSRHGSGQGGAASGASGLRGPRVNARGPRTSTGSVSSMIQNLNNKGTVAGPPPPPSSPLGRTTPRMSGSASAKPAPGGAVRPSSVLGRAQAFSTKMTTSDTEDDVDRK